MNINIQERKILIMLKKLKIFVEVINLKPSTPTSSKIKVIIHIKIFYLYLFFYILIFKEEIKERMEKFNQKQCLSCTHGKNWDKKSK